MYIALINTSRRDLIDFQTKIELGGGECLRLNGVLVWPDHFVSFYLDDLEKKSQFWL